MQQEDISEKIEVITINIGHNDSELRADHFARTNKMPYPVIFDEKSKITTQYKVFGVPTVIVADTGGTIVFRQYYVPQAEELIKLLR